MLTRNFLVNLSRDQKEEEKRKKKKNVFQGTHPGITGHIFSNFFLLSEVHCSVQNLHLHEESAPSLIVWFCFELACITKVEQKIVGVEV